MGTGTTLESVVEVPGPAEVRNLQISVLQPDGSVKRTQMQVVAICDSDGIVLDLDHEDTLQTLLNVARQQRELQSMLVRYFMGVHFTADDLEQLIAAH